MFDKSKAYDLKISKEGKNGCWKWLGLKDKNGYGHFWHGGRKRNVRAHRYSLELSTGQVGSGLMALHSCDNPECCNPDHLEPVTRRENIMRSPIAVTAIHARKTECPRCGSAYTTERRGGRRCRPCLYRAERARRAAQ